MPRKSILRVVLLRRGVWSLFLAIAMPSALLSCGGKNEPPVSEANRLFIEAQDLRAQGKNDEAIQKLTASIAVEPTLWAYTERAKLYAKTGNDQAAIEDCEAALKIFPNEPDLLWLKGEFNKPKDQQFHGRFATPPSANR
jgi:tetratricopeptide (TPR) repeat protein